MWWFAAAFAALSVVAGSGWLYGADVYLMRAAQSSPSDLLDAAGRFFSTVGSWEVTGVLLLTLVVTLWLGDRRRLAGRLLLAFLATGLLEILLKTFLPVPPIPEEFRRLGDFATVATVEPPYPYPSGHVLRAVILLGSGYLMSRSRLLRVALAAALLGLASSRVYLGVHWASDVAGGALLGFFAVLWAFEREDAGWRSR